MSEPSTTTYPSDGSSTRTPAAARTENGPALPDIASLTADRESVSPGQTVTFSWSAGDDDGLLAGFIVDFGDGTTTRGEFASRCVTDPSDPVAPRPSFDHTYSTTGTYQITVTTWSTGACGAGTTQSTAATTAVRVAVLTGVPAVLSHATTSGVTLI